MEKGTGLAPSFPYLFLLLPVLLSLLRTTQSAKLQPMFIFSNSLIDIGNNFIPSTAKADYEPYGIDFGQRTCWFCNGLTVADYGAKTLGLPFPSPYLRSLASRTTKIFNGVNYRPAAAGILDETGGHYGARVPFKGQIALFAKTVSQELPALIPNAEELVEFIASSVLVVNIGSKDYVNNYLLPNLYASSRTYSTDGSLILSSTT